MPKVVLDLNDRRPAWALPPWVAEEVAAALPEGWTLQVMENPADGSGDGMVNLDPALVDATRDAEVYLGYGVPAAILREGKELRWVHSGAAGVKGSLTPEMKASPVLFTNSKGIHAPPMGDTALVELAASTVGIYGYGGVGREVGKRARALEARVLAFDRVPFPSPDPGLESLHGADGFSRLLAESDFLVLTAPETPETVGALDAAALARMKPTAVLVNLSRGRIVDEEALVAALREGRLRGAGLDVYATEPLPPGHPLWELPNVVMTPHVSAVTRHFWRRQTDLIVENLRRYLAGERLLNRVDKEAGF